MTLATNDKRETIIVGTTSDRGQIPFPLVCETCLGPNKFVRMQKFTNGGICHISGRPYDVFRWKAGDEARYKKTVICQELAKLKNVCQVCMLDLEYNLPVQIRDLAMNRKKTILPQSDIGKNIAINKLISAGPYDNVPGHSLDPPDDILMKLVRTEAHYKRNQARICSFFVKGCCNRGLECPFRHTVPSSGEIAKQNYHDRFHGLNDPVARRMLARAARMPSLKPPSDLNITTIFIGNITSTVTAKDLKDNLFQYGELDTIKMIYRRNCAFVTFASRKGAERAVSHLNKYLRVNGQSLVIRWSKPKSQRDAGRNKFHENGSSSSKSDFSPFVIGGIPESNLSVSKRSREAVSCSPQDG